VINLELTESGKVLVEKLPIIAINVLNRYLQGFSGEELEQMKIFLRRLLANGGIAVPPPSTDSASTIE
jgi:DNA-binding MarR family transcriptional regulator